MILYNWAYRRLIKRKKGAKRVRDILVKLKDPIIDTCINGNKCSVPFSHMGIVYMNWYHLYDVQLKCICDYLESVYNRKLFVVDVGANVGDTILCIGNKTYKYLAVEGVERYTELLAINTKEYDVIKVKAFCGDYSDSIVCGVANIDSGTAQIVEAKKSEVGSGVEVLSLDSILAINEYHPDFIKIDTDGFDFKVLRGALKCLENEHPVIYFEWTMPELVSNGENLLSIFEYLNGLGYFDGILFDKFGCPLIRFDTNQIMLLSDLIDYSGMKDLYYDVVVFHKESNLDINTLWKLLKR